MKRTLLTLLSCAFAMLLAARAEAQNGDLRLSLDTDMFSVSFIHIETDGAPGEAEATVIGFGPNQLGGSRTYAPATPLGLGIGYGISNKLILGVRTGLGFDVVDWDGAEDKERVLALSLMPGLTFVPIGNRAKLFITLAGLFQVNRTKVDDNKDRYLLGGFSTGIGALIFPTSAFSADLGFFFEGRFGGHDPENGPDQDIRDLRAIVRLGFSLWR